MESTLLLPPTLDLNLLDYEVLTEQVNLKTLSNSSSSTCPLCGHKSDKIHSYYHRHISDLPTGGKQVIVQLRVGKYFCVNSDCKRQIFTERFTTGLASYGRRFERLNEVLTFCGLESGGNSSTRQVEYFAVKISASTILRLIQKCKIPIIVAPKVIGVDDWAFKKRCTYGTIIIDLETRQVIDLLPDREANTLVKWLLKHPTIEVVSRDRSTTYASAIKEGSPQAVQVADRWHILKNLTETLERFLDTQRDSIREIAVQLSRINQNKEQKPPIEPIIVINEECLQIEERTNEAVPKSKYYDKFLKAKELQAKGYSIRKIAIYLKMSRNTVKKHWTRSKFVPKASNKRSNVLDFEDYLQQRWKEGVHSSKALYEEIKLQGYKYSLRTVFDVVRYYPKSLDEPMPESVKATYYSSKQLSIWLGIHQKDWAKELPIEFLQKLLEDSPIISKVRLIIFEFKQLMREKEGDKLQDWCKAAIETGVESLKSFVNGINQDFQAVYQAFVSPWSNGQVEGQVNRLKNIKRQMYGRAGFELLRRRVIITSQS